MNIIELTQEETDIVFLAIRDYFCNTRGHKKREKVVNVYTKLSPFVYKKRPQPSNTIQSIISDLK